MVLVSGIWHNDLIFIYSGMIITNLVTCVIQSCIFFFMMRAFKIYSISNFKICNTVLLTIVILPYVPPPQYLFYILEFVPFDPIHLFHFHPSSLPLATTNLFYLWAWLKKYIYILHMEWSIYMVFVFVWPTSLSIMPSRSIHIVANDNVLLFLKAELSYNWILKWSVILSNLGVSSLFL